MLPRKHPDRIRVSFDDHRRVATAGLTLPTNPGPPSRTPPTGPAVGPGEPRVAGPALGGWGRTRRRTMHFDLDSTICETSPLT